MIDQYVVALVDDPDKAFVKGDSFIVEGCKTLQCCGNDRFYIDVGLKPPKGCSQVIGCSTCDNELHVSEIWMFYPSHWFGIIDGLDLKKEIDDAIAADLKESELEIINS